MEKQRETDNTKSLCVTGRLGIVSTVMQNS